MSDLSRRDFLKAATAALLAGSALLGLDALFRFFDYETEPPVKTEFDLGLTSNFPPDSRTVLVDVPAVLVHNENGFMALSLICTHLGCTVEPKTDGFTCPCHGSRYDKTGNVLRGPAQKALRSLRVAVNEQDHVVLYTN